jgi:hypothetical protein
VASWRCDGSHLLRREVQSRGRVEQYRPEPVGIRSVDEDRQGSALSTLSIHTPLVLFLSVCCCWRSSVHFELSAQSCRKMPENIDHLAAATMSRKSTLNLGLTHSRSHVCGITLLLFSEPCPLSSLSVDVKGTRLPSCAFGPCFLGVIRSSGKAGV